MQNTHGLIAPASFWELSEAEINRRYEGCGPGKIGDMLVPDYFFGKCMRLCCQVHDFEYEHGKTLQDKFDADCRLLHNFYIMIEDDPVSWLTQLRYNRAECYYEMVAAGGMRAYMRGKHNVAAA